MKRLVHLTGELSGPLLAPHKGEYETHNLLVDSFTQVLYQAQETSSRKLVIAQKGVKKFQPASLCLTHEQPAKINQQNQ
ncbi:hypothetical protein [Cohaesibacter sp. ES.047]|uniref:hypothetical protein n=1 Tax=Cohaesibacter sp. ES.047 TaxID=1798205 RepID=UPI00156148CD|nr:hypothetical protein [Cohaesibacter sp. ES.047]